VKFQTGSIFLIVALALALSLHNLAQDSFWGDEILTVTFAARSPAEIIRWSATDIHPPLYYLLAGAFATLTLPPTATPAGPASDWLWRFPSAVAHVLATAITYRLALGLLHRAGISKNHPQKTRSVANAAVLLLALAPVAIKYGQEARMHGLFMLLAALSTWLFILALKRPCSAHRWLAYALAITAAIYTMYFGFLILAAQGLLLLSSLAQTPPKTLRQPKTVGFGAASAVALLLYAPWWPVLFGILRRRAAAGAIEGGVGNPLTFLAGVVSALGPSPSLAAGGFLLLFITGLILLGRHAWPVALFGLAWLALPAALPIVLGDPRALQFRYAFVLPVYLIIIAYATVTVGQRLESVFSTRGVSTYLIWIVASLSFVATLQIYNQTKPNWRAAAAYLNENVAPADIILFGPLWDEGRFIGYYYRGQAQLLTPAAMVTNIERRARGLRAGGGRIWAVNRFAPQESGGFKNISFPGVVVSEPLVTVYEPALLAGAALDLAGQAVEAAYPWAEQAQNQGVLDPDPRTARAAALRAWGDTLLAANRPEEAIEAYQTAVDIFPGWVGGFLALAQAHEAVGNVPAAVAAYRQAVAFNLAWHGSQANEAARLANRGRWADALAKYHQIIGD